MDVVVSGHWVGLAIVLTHSCVYGFDALVRIWAAALLVAWPHGVAPG